MIEHVSTPGSAAKAKIRQQLKPPPMYKVLLHNDNYTTMDFVVYILEAVFQKSHHDAVRIMLNVHEEGVGVCGVYCAEVAETKVTAVHKLAKTNGFPLKCSMEPE